jgi:hypothetical protein
MKNLLSYIIGIPIFLVLAVKLTAWIIWFLPLVVIVYYCLLFGSSWSVQRWVIYVLIGSSCSGLWAILLLNVIGPNLPASLQTLLTIHIDPHSQPIIIGRYFIGGMDAGEFLGYISLVGIGGSVLLAIFIAMKIIVQVPSRSQRIWLLRFSVALIIGGGTFLVYLFAHEYWLLFGFISYIVGIGFLTEKTDPREELEM